MVDTRPLLLLPPPHQGKSEKDLLALMAATRTCFREQGEGRWQIRQRREDGAFVTLAPKSLAKACGAVARFSAGDEEVPLPFRHARNLLASAFIGRLPREWAQVRQFLNAGGGSFRDYCAWCKERNEVAAADTETRFRTALGAIRQADRG